VISEGPFAFLPGSELLDAGLADLRRAAASLPALLVAQAWPRLEPLGLVTRAMAERVRAPGEDFELTAYRLLAASHGQEAHARLLALLDELDSGITALERERRQVTAGRAPGPKPVP
jgi:hypothetical protein